MKIFKRKRALFIIGAILAITAACSVLSRSGTEVSYLNFPEKLTPTTPYDVDTALESKLANAQKFGEVQRLFEVLSWQMFISLNWPLDKDGQPAADITDTGYRAWEHWKESYEVFKDSGAAPKPWDSGPDLPAALRSKINPALHEELLFRTSKFTSFDKSKFKVNLKGRPAVPQTNEDIDQAFSSSIWDQSGNVVRYEIRLNKPTVDYIVKNDLYNIDGQIVFSSQKKMVSFPVSTTTQPGAIELKFAWKVMKSGTDADERYFTKRVQVLDSATNKGIEITVGLVGMHIGIKTVSSPQWIWATFEQVDNVETNAMTMVHGHSLRPSFNNPDSSTLPIDVFPAHRPLKNQIQRVIPIPVATQELNRQVQDILKKANSFWQYYQLIGTQWPTQPNVAAYPLLPKTYKLPDAVTNKSGGMPTPTYLTNMVMETYFQGETIGGDTTAYYNTQIANEPAYFQIEGNPDTTDKPVTHKLIFGTESCIGCHSSASIAIGYCWKDTTKCAIFDNARKGDFEWLMQRKAQFLPYKAPRVIDKATCCKPAK
jgi:hypothetical protein